MKGNMICQVCKVKVKIKV